MHQSIKINQSIGSGSPRTASRPSGAGARMSTYWGHTGIAHGTVPGSQFPALHSQAPAARLCLVGLTGSWPHPHRRPPAGWATTGGFQAILGMYVLRRELGNQRFPLTLLQAASRTRLRGLGLETRNGETRNEQLSLSPGGRQLGIPGGSDLDNSARTDKHGVELWENDKQLVDKSFGCHETGTVGTVPDVHLGLVRSIPRELRGPRPRVLQRHR